MTDWRTIECGNCGGGEVVSDYTMGGSDFLGPKECDWCGGGVLWVLPSGHMFAWPGGPARGMDKLAYAEGVEPGHQEGNSLGIEEVPELIGHLLSEL